MYTMWPGPIQNQSKIEYLDCTICKKEVKYESIFCSLCQHWVHPDCVDLKRNDLLKMGENKYGDWFCSPCTDEIFPFLESLEIDKSFEQNLKNNSEFITHTDCSSCSKQVKGESMCCSLCSHWVHKKCISKFSNRRKLHSKQTNSMPETFENMNNFYKNKDWFCFQCSKSIFPFLSLSDEDFLISSNLDNNDHRKTIENMKNKLREINLLSEINESDSKECDFDKFDPDKNFTYNDNYEYTSSMNFQKPNDTEISILNFNIRSIKKNFDEFTKLLCLSNINFDVITLTETWMDNNSCLEDYTIEGYLPPSPKTGKIDLEGVY